MASLTAWLPLVFSGLTVAGLFSGAAAALAAAIIGAVGKCLAAWLGRSEHAIALAHARIMSGTVQHDQAHELAPRPLEASHTPAMLAAIPDCENPLVSL